MQRYFLSYVLAVLLGTLAGLLVGFIAQQIAGQEGWGLLAASLGANAGAFWTAWRRAAGKPVWRER